MSEYNIKAIIFDAGNVLVRFNHTKAYEKLSKYSNLSVEEIINLISNGDKSPSSLHDSGKLSSHDFFLTIQKQINLNKNLSFEEFSNIWGDIFEENTEIEPIIDKIHKNIKLCILSNTDPIHWSVVEKLPLLKKHFSNKNIVILSYNSKVCKPETKIYNDALISLGMIIEDTKNILYIEDIAKYRQAFENIGGHTLSYDCSKDSVSVLENALKEYRVI